MGDAVLCALARGGLAGVACHPRSSNLFGIVVLVVGGRLNSLWFGVSLNLDLWFANPSAF